MQRANAQKQQGDSCVCAHTDSTALQDMYMKFHCPPTIIFINHLITATALPALLGQCWSFELWLGLILQILCHWGILCSPFSVIALSMRISSNFISWCTMSQYPTVRMKSGYDKFETKERHKKRYCQHMMMFCVKFFLISP